MIPAYFHNHLFVLILISILWILATVHAQPNVSVDKFLLAIWYAKIPETTLVRCANREDPDTDPAIDGGSKVQLTSTGLELKDPTGRVQWRCERLTDDSEVTHAAMLDTRILLGGKQNLTLAR
ncbi:hypothetical protein PTKIN_Ptkin14bG0042500 [Pterospermum kingtungense]